MEIKEALVVYARPYAREQKLTYRTVKKTLEKINASIESVERMELTAKNFIDKDIVIAVGGDGTFLRAAQFIKDETQIIGVNSDIKSKEGFYMKCNRFDFKNKLQKMLKNKFRISKLLRLEASINDKIVGELALNEFYFGASKAYMTSRYKIRIGNRSESQRSSGVIVFTPTGSRAWSRAVGVKQLPINFRGFGFIVREPFEYKLFSNYKLKKKIVNNQSVVLKSEMQSGILVADSISKEYTINYGDTLKIGVSDKSVNTIDV